MGFFDQPKARMPTTRARLYQPAPGQASSSPDKAAAQQPPAPQVPSTGYRRPGTPMAGQIAGGAGPSAPIVNRSSFASQDGVQAGRDDGPHTADAADSGDYRGQYSGGLWQQSNGPGAMLPRQTPTQQLQGSMGQMPGTPGPMRMVSPPFQSPGLNNQNQLGEQMARSQMFAQRQQQQQQQPTAQTQQPLSWKGHTYTGQSTSAQNTPPPSTGTGTSGQGLTASSVSSSSSGLTGAEAAQGTNDAIAGVTGQAQNQAAQQTQNAVNSQQRHFPGMDEDTLKAAVDAGYHFSADGNTLIGPDGHALNLEDEGGLATAKGIINSFQSNIEKQRQKDEDAKNKAEYDAMYQKIADMPAAQIDEGKVNSLVKADAQKRAMEQSRAMMAAMQLGANAGVSPEASQGQVADLQQQGGAQAAESGARIRMNAEQQNLQGKIAANQQKAASLMAMAGWTKDMNQRAFLLQAANEARRQSMQDQMAWAKYQQDLAGQISDRDIFGAGANLIGKVAGTLLGG